MKRELEHLLPADIERRSFEIISAELEGRGIALLEETAPIVKRVIHTTADFDYAESLVFSPGVVETARAALREAGTAVMRPWRRGSFACSYARYERLRRLLEERGARVEETLFGAEVEIVFSAPETQSESFVTLLRDATAGEAEVRLGESVFRPEREEE